MRKAQKPAIPESRVADHSAESKPYTHFAYLTSNTDCQRCGYTDSGNNFRAFCSSLILNLVETCQPQPHFHNKEV
ncbi:MAG: hypothetical protein HXS48_27225 [Theionarchaea archaeon]|nr:MAG: hypothetical protein AYK19_08040 [Theionarchaea archaeon DG-70-1]MBU7030655.1 hypothetical protein [Theionarchaea archaeon]